MLCLVGRFYLKGLVRQNVAEPANCENRTEMLNLSKTGMSQLWQGEALA